MRINAETQNQTEHQRHKNIGKRPGRADYSRTPLLVFQIIRIIRNRLGPAENKGRTGEHQKKWQNNRTEKIKVLYGIKSQPAGIFGGRVAQKIRRVTVRNLVNHGGH